MILTYSCKYMLRFIFILFTACSIQNNTENNTFRYFNQSYQTGNCNGLNTGYFYWNNTLNSADSLFFTYLRFKPDGLLIYQSNTSMQPDTMFIWTAMWNPVCNKNRKPKDSHINYGYYTCKNDSVFGTIKYKTLFGMWDIYEITGKINTNALTINIKHTGTGSITEKYEYKNLLFKYYNH